MTSSLVGSEMCIRDRANRVPGSVHVTRHRGRLWVTLLLWSRHLAGRIAGCLLYTSDAADDM
eukprot:10686935-Prorocentrum_lima.AAC.1